MTDPEIEEDLMDPNDELKKKIVALANTLKEWNKKTKEARKSVREQLKDIIVLGTEKRKMDNTELRKLINEIFLYHGIHPSWLRKLLPEGLKDTSKTRISYLQRQEIENERQRLLRQISESQEASNPRASSPLSLKPTMEFKSEEISQSDNSAVEFETSDHEVGTTTENRLNEAYKRIEKLEVQRQQLSELFITRANLQTPTQDIPLIAQIDPVERVITWIRIDKAS
jgi:hypothetical protein